MSDEQAEHNREVVNIPVAIAAQTINYNLPGLNGEAGLKLDGATLAGIFTGTISDVGRATDRRVQSGGYAAARDHYSGPPRRASGDTFVFTQFLDFSTQSWEDKIGYGTSVAWPAVPGEQTATGNAGMVQALTAAPYTIGYIGISFHARYSQGRLGHRNAQEPGRTIRAADCGQGERRCLGTGSPYRRPTNG